MSSIDRVSGPHESAFTSNDKTYFAHNKAKSKTKHHSGPEKSYRDIIKAQALYKKSNVANSFVFKKPEASNAKPLPAPKTHTNKKETFVFERPKPDKQSHQVKSTIAETPQRKKQLFSKTESTSSAQIKPPVTTKESLLSEDEKENKASNCNVYASFIRKELDVNAYNAFAVQQKTKTRNAFNILTQKIPQIKVPQTFALQTPLSTGALIKVENTSNNVSNSLTINNIHLANDIKQEQSNFLATTEPIIKTTRAPQELRTIADAIKDAIQKTQRENVTKQKQLIAMQQKTSLAVGSPKLLTDQNLDPSTPKDLPITTQVIDTQTTAIKGEFTLFPKTTTLKESLEYLEEVASKRKKTYLRQHQIIEQTRKHQHKLNKQLHNQILSERLHGNFLHKEEIIVHQQKESIEQIGWLFYDLLKKDITKETFMDEVIEVNQVKKNTKGLANNLIDKNLKDFSFLEKKQQLAILIDQTI